MLHFLPFTIVLYVVMCCTGVMGKCCLITVCTCTATNNWEIKEKLLGPKMGRQSWQARLGMLRVEKAILESPNSWNPFILFWKMQTDWQEESMIARLKESHYTYYTLHLLTIHDYISHDSYCTGRLNTRKQSIKTVIRTRIILSSTSAKTQKRAY